MSACSACWDLSGNLDRNSARAVSLFMCYRTQVVVPDASDTKEAEVQRLRAHTIVVRTPLCSYIRLVIGHSCEQHTYGQSRPKVSAASDHPAKSQHSLHNRIGSPQRLDDEQ